MHKDKKDSLTMPAAFEDLKVNPNAEIVLNKRYLKKLQPQINKINELEPSFKALTDEQLKAKTVEFKERLAKGETLDDLLPEAFAAVVGQAKNALTNQASA